MAAADLYRYGAQHFEHHRKQLTLSQGESGSDQFGSDQFGPTTA